MASKIDNNTETPAQRVVRRRFGGPRSRSGCITCRVRRVKCDEKKPECERCTKTGRKCDGYASKPWEIIGVTSIASTMMPSVDPRVSPSEYTWQGFKVFEQITSDDLAGLFESSLWQDVLRASQHNDAIWYAATALGSAHEAYLRGRFETPSQEQERAILQYNRAIKSFGKPDASNEQPPLVIVMAASILFMAFEMLRREYGKAINHIQSGIRIFGEHKSRIADTYSTESQSPDMISIQQLENVLRQLETHLCELSMEHFHRPVMPRLSFVGRQILPQLNETWLSNPVGFESINEARLKLDSYWHNLMYMLYELSHPEISNITLSPENVQRICQEYLDSFASWQMKFDVLLQTLHAKPEPLTSNERKAIALLQLYQLGGTQILETCLVPGEMLWDARQHEFERMLDLCDIVAGYSLQGNNSSEEYVGFQLDHGIIAACFHVLWKCRSARVRHHGLKLLRQQRKEGLWDAQLVSMIVKYIDEIERGADQLYEAALRNAGPEEIPFSRRIIGLNVKFSEEGQTVMVTFMKLGGQENSDLVTIDRELSW